MCWQLYWRDAHPYACAHQKPFIRHPQHYSGVGDRNKVWPLCGVYRGINTLLRPRQRWGKGKVVETTACQWQCWKSYSGENFSLISTFYGTTSVIYILLVYTTYKLNVLLTALVSPTFPVYKYHIHIFRHILKSLTHSPSSFYTHLPHQQTPV